MPITFDGHPYELLFGSDVQRDGVYLELNDVSGATPVAVLFAFYSDADGRMTFSAYREDVPFGAVEWFIAEARRRLPSVTPASDAAGGSSPSRPAG
jgi:hypothetical protein